MGEKLFKTKTATPLNDCVKKDQFFAWNKYVKLFLLVFSALLNVGN